jgi:uncharacterized protein (TIGR04255 family)
MSTEFPITLPDKLPSKITPCSIVEAVLEVRFATAESWTTLPGLLYAQIRDRYPEQKDLPLTRIPEDIRRQEPALLYKPLVQFLSPGFLVQLGARVVSLVTKPNEYPGWAKTENEMAWLLKQARQAGFVAEAERLSVRYIDFFEFDIFPKLLLNAVVGAQPLAGNELSITTVLRSGPWTSRLALAHGARLATGRDVREGSGVGVETWVGSLNFDLFENGLEKFREAHLLTNQIFFGLMRPEFLTTLKAEYS